jgi:mutator protein MutT
MKKLLIKTKYKLGKLYWKIIKPITIGVRIIIINDNKVLLVKHSYGGKWYLPGGKVEKNESLREAIKRELKEELNIDLKEFDLFGAYSNNNEYKNDHIIIYLTKEKVILKKHYNIEIEKVEFFDVKKLPSNVSPGTKRRIKEYLNNKSENNRW